MGMQKWPCPSIGDKYCTESLTLGTTTIPADLDDLEPFV